MDLRFRKISGNLACERRGGATEGDLKVLSLTYSGSSFAYKGGRVRYKWREAVSPLG